MELAARTKAERSKQDEVGGRTTGSGGGNASGSAKRKSTPVQPSRSKKNAKTNNTPLTSPPTNRSKKEKLLCICRTPYDDTK